MGSSGGSGGGAERISTSKAKTQLSAKQKSLQNSTLAKTPGIGGALAMAMGNLSLSAQQKALDEGGTAVAVPGTSYAPQGQAYTEAPGMKSSAGLASRGLAVGSGFGKSTASKPTGSIGVYSATKPGNQSGMGYVGDVAGVVTQKEVFGKTVSTFTGKTGYSPTGVKESSAPSGGGSSAPTAQAPAVDTTTPSAQLSAAAKSKIAQSAGSSVDRRLFIV